MRYILCIYYAYIYIVFYITNYTEISSSIADVEVIILASVIIYDTRQVRGLAIDDDRDKSLLNGKTMIENGGRTGSKTSSDKRWSYRARSIGR